jgi:hypothetical protein
MSVPCAAGSDWNNSILMICIVFRNYFKKRMKTMRKHFLILMMSWFIFCPAAYADLADNGDGTVTDTKTGLMWQQGEAGAMTWTDALTYCENLQLASHDDWRLPNRNELESLIDYSTYDPAINTVAFPGAVSADYWSSTTNANNTVTAWLVYFGNGGVGYSNESHSLNVRAVRGGQ